MPLVPLIVRAVRSTLRGTTLGRRWACANNQQAARGVSTAAPSRQADDEVPGFELRTGPPGSVCLACAGAFKKLGLLLKDKWALVTGASHGIGRALAEELARESAAVILTSDMLSQDGLDKAAKNCQALGAPEVRTVVANLVLPKEVDKVAGEALKIAGRVDVLVNNAGKYKPMTFDQGPNKGQGPLDGDPDEWDEQTMLNLAAPMRLTRHLVPEMVEHGGGWVINIVSAEAIAPYPSAPVRFRTFQEVPNGTCLKQWGLRGWSLSCFEYLRHKKIKVMAVNPGATSTPMRWKRPDADYVPELMIQPEEVAKVVLQAFALRDNTVMEEITLQARPRPLHCLGSSLTHLAETALPPEEPKGRMH